MKRDFPYFAEIWSELWDEEISHNAKVNEAGVFVDKMPVSVEKTMIENLGHGYVPKKVEAEIPTSVFMHGKNPTYQTPTQRNKELHLINSIGM